MSRKKTLIVLMVVVAAIGLLISAGMKSSMGQYMTLQEALAAEKQGEVPGFIQIESKVDLKTVKYDPQGPKLSFEIYDDKDRIPVVFKDVKPDNFDSGYPVIVEGKFDQKHIFQADKLMVKCPSKYEEDKLQPGEAPGLKKKS